MPQPSSIKIQDARGRFIMVPAGTPESTMKIKAKEFLIQCDIRNTASRTFGGSEYSSEALARAAATRATSSVKLVKHRR
ncbi:hypothetical protein RRF57_013366 [Xylaria bambusicola]|uniref:Uncharacterized protein n=1 Tax=Xylaria bambusicola TaxID=326684 RepID=A0AAN7V2S1_9PEZI